MLALLKCRRNLTSFSLDNPTCNAKKLLGNDFSFLATGFSEDHISTNFDLLEIHVRSSCKYTQVVSVSVFSLIKKAVAFHLINGGNII